MARVLTLGPLSPRFDYDDVVAIVAVIVPPMTCVLPFLKGTFAVMLDIHFGHTSMNESMFDDSKKTQGATFHVSEDPFSKWEKGCH